MTGTAYESVDTLNDRMEFDHVIASHGDGRITDAEGVYAPEVYDEEIMADGWTLLDGFSGQYRYSGPVMHPSEYIGGGLARYILETPGIYVAVISEDLDDLDEPFGWAVAVKDQEA